MNGWLSSTSNWLKKQYFNSAHYLEILSNQGQKLSQGDIHLFGIKFDPSRRKQAFQLYQSVLWFTYRDNIHFKGHPTVTSDIGWGCMLRVGQMMLAQVLRVQKGPQFYSDQRWLEGVIGEFVGQDGRFCIERLVGIGGKVLDKEPGQWYSSYDIALVLKHALQEDTLPIKNKYIDTEPIELIITTSQFSLKDVYQQTKIVIKNQPEVYKTRPCLLVIVCRLGYQKPQQNLLNSLLQILKHQTNCMGLLGGRPGKAHYIFGTTQKSFIYLDPHCVRHQLDIESFLCETLFSMPHDKIDPSLAICLYLHDFKQMVVTHERLRQLGCNQLVYCHQYDKFQCMTLEIEGERKEEEEFYQVLEQ